MKSHEFDKDIARLKELAGIRESRSLWNKFTDVVSSLYPDGDPIDWMISTGALKPDEFGELKRQGQEHGYDHPMDYWNEFESDHDADRAHDIFMFFKELVDQGFTGDRNAAIEALRRKGKIDWGKEELLDKGLRQKGYTSVEDYVARHT